MFAIDADSKCGEAGVIEVSEQFVREALEAKDQLKQLQDAVMALLLDIDNAYVEVDGEHVEPIMSTEAYNLVREVLKDVQK